MDITQNALGKLIKKHRMAKHMTQKTLAELIGVQTKSISYIERGINYPSTENLFKMIVLLDISIDDFIYGQTQFHTTISIQEINELLDKLPPNLCPAFIEIVKSTAEILTKLK